MSKKTYEEHLREDWRLLMLRILSEQNGYSCNNSIIQAAMSRMGVAIGGDHVLSNAAWLRDQLLVTISEPVPGVEVYTLTGRGQEVAQGLVTVPGVSRPNAR